MPNLPRRSLLIAALMATPLAAEAQARAREPQAPAEMPEEMRPPAGKCRIWMQGVAPQQQPAPTDCATALRQKPANGTVVFGPTRGREIESRGFQTHPRPARRDSASRRVTPLPARVPARDSLRPAQRTKERRAPTPQPARTRPPARPTPDSVPARTAPERPS